MRLLLASLFLLCGPGFLSANDAAKDPSDIWTGRGTMPVPEGARVTLACDQKDYLLGENVLVDFVLENVGKETFKADVGGDYRGCDRNLRFKVTATDAQGHEAPCPDPEPMWFGGVGTQLKVDPGQKLIFSIPLLRYRQIDAPGIHTIRASHDFGWKAGSDKIPTGEIAISFRMPTPEEAAQVVAAMEKLPDNVDGTWGKKSAPYADFRCLRYPVYLTILAPLAKTGDARALEAISSLPSSEATQTLIDLANETDPKLSLQSALALNGRLPDPEFDGKLDPRGPFRIYGNARRKEMAKMAWTPNFAGPVRDLGRKFLARPDKEAVACGAFMIEAVGTLDDAPDVFKALDHALDSGGLSPRHDIKVDVLDFPAPIPELIRAVQMLQARGFDNSHPSGDGQILGYFLSFVGKPGPRPPNWKQFYEAWGEANSYPIRQTALQSIPIPMPDDCVKYVQHAMAAEDYGVNRTACEIAGKSGRKEFLQPVLEIIATENEPWLLREAGNTACKLGGEDQALGAWADRLGDVELTDIALDYLTKIIDGLPGGSSGRTDLTRSERLALRDAWKKFLAANADEISHGKKIRYDNPAVSRAMFGRARTYNLPNGKLWPMTTEEQSKPPTTPPQ